MIAINAVGNAPAKIIDVPSVALVPRIMISPRPPAPTNAPIAVIPMAYVDIVSKNAAKQNYTTTVLIPQFVPNRRWQNILHNQTSLRLRLRLSWRENIVVSTYSYHLKK